MIIKTTKKFEKDIARAKKRCKKMEKLKLLISQLASAEDLEKKYRDHALVDNYVGRRECHLEPDWLLIYRQTEDFIILERTGSHSDLFK